MGGINFLDKSDENNSGSQSRRYQFEYTNPALEKARKKKRKSGSLLSRSKKSKAPKARDSKKSKAATQSDGSVFSVGPATSGKAGAVIDPKQTSPAKEGGKIKYAPKRSELSQADKQERGVLYSTQTAAPEPTPISDGDKTPFSTKVSKPAPAQAPVSAQQKIVSPSKPTMVAPERQRPVSSIDSSLPQFTETPKKSRVIPTPPPPPQHKVAKVKKVVPQKAQKSTAKVKPVKPHPQPIPVAPAQVAAPVAVPAAAAPSKSVVPAQPVIDKTLPQFTEAPKKSRVIPTPPLPPKHEITKAEKVAPVPAVPQPIAISSKKPTIPSAPAVPEPQQSIPHQPVRSVAPQPKTTTPAAPQPTTEGLEQAQHAAIIDAPGKIHAQNVEHDHGHLTDPQDSDDAGLGVNLLPEDLLRQLNPISRVIQLVKLALITITGVGLVFAGMIGYQSYFIIQTKNNQVEISRLENEITGFSNLQQEINARNEQITTVANLLQQHTYWTNVFTVLEAYTLQNVYYTSFTANSEGSITVKAVTTDFASVAQQVTVMNDAQDIISVTSSQAKRSTKSSGEESEEVLEELGESVTESVVDDVKVVQFSMSIQIDPTVLHNNNYAVND